MVLPTASTNMSTGQLTARCPPDGPCAGRRAAACAAPGSPSAPGGPGRPRGPSSAAQTANPQIRVKTNPEIKVNPTPH